MKCPTKEECLKILDEYGTPEHVKGHCRGCGADSCDSRQSSQRKGI